MQGDLWRVANGLFAGGVVLVFPTLLVVVRPEPFYSVGPLQEAWWVLVVTSLVGLFLLWRAFTDMFRLARRTAQALDNGHDPVLLALVVADRGRDSGFLLQGERAFSVLSESARRLVIRLRLVGVAAFLTGGLWLSAAFVAAVLMGSRGLLSPAQVTIVPTLPCAFLMAMGGLALLWEHAMVAHARREWHSRPWVDDLKKNEILRWNAALRAKNPPIAGGAGGSAVLRLAMAATLLLALGVTLPMVALTATSSVTPLLGVAAVPRYERTQTRAAEVEPLRRYAVETDSALSPGEAGEILNVILRAGNSTPGPEPERPADRVYRDGFLPEGDPQDDPTGIPPYLWPTRLFPELRTLSPEGVEYLRRVAAHPALTELSSLARAPAIDVAYGRWRVPYPEDLTVTSFPIPRMSALRQVGYAQIARAAVATLDGREADAELRLRELISYGLLLGDNGPTLLDNLVGYVAADGGGDALSTFYRVTGRGSEAETLSWARETARAAAAKVQVGMATTPLATLQEMPEVVVDPTALRGLRWEFFVTLSTVAPCLNLNRVVFGPGDEYQAWLEQARVSLVHFPSEAPLFDLMSQGYLGRVGPYAPQGIADRLLGLALGGSQVTGSCAQSFREMAARR